MRRIGKTDQALRLGDGPAVQASLNSSGWSLRRSDSTIKRSPSAWPRRSLTCSRCDVSSADLIIRNSFDGDGQGRLARRAPPALVPWMTVLPNRIGTMLP